MSDSEYSEVEGESSKMVDLKSWKAPEGTSEEDAGVIRYVLACRNESKEARWNSIMQTRENYDVNWGRHDFSHKIDGQSREVLSMQQMAVEQASAYFQQALIDIGGQWWSCLAKNPKNEEFLLIPPSSIYSITEDQLQKANLLRHVGIGLKSGILGGIIITKVHGCWKSVPKYVASPKTFYKKAKLQKHDKKVWQLKYDLVSQFNFYPDPTGGKLYQIEDMFVDYHEVCALAEGEDAIYDKDIVEQLENRTDDDAEAKFDKQRRNNQNETNHAFRGRVKITELWGKILNDEGEVIHDNCVVTIANDKWLIRKPSPNPLWHQKSPYVVTPLLDMADTEWPRALADSGTKYNIASNELFNLMLDGAMRAVNGVGQVRQDWLEDPAQIEGGIRPGTNLNVNSQCPPGAKVLEQVMTGEVPQDGLAIFNLLQQEFNRSMMTSDIRQGLQPRNDVPATQIVEASQTISSMFKGISERVEQNWVKEILELSWMTCCQYIKDMDEAELTSILEPDTAEKIKKLSAEEIFANTVHGIHFNVFGLSLTQQKAQDFKKFATLIQTISSTEILQEEFIKAYDPAAVLEYGMRSIGIPINQIKRSHYETDLMNQKQEGGPQPPAGGQPNQMSQVPSPNTGSQADQQGSAATADQKMQEFVARGTYGGKRG